MGDRERKATIARLRNQIDDLHQKHHARLERIAKAIGGLVKECKHTKRKRYPDPAGGNDYCFECLVCGKEW